MHPIERAPPSRRSARSAYLPGPDGGEYLPTCDVIKVASSYRFATATLAWTGASRVEPAQRSMRAVVTASVATSASAPVSSSFPAPPARIAVVMRLPRRTGPEDHLRAPVHACPNSGRRRPISPTLPQRRFAVPVGAGIANHRRALNALAVNGGRQSKTSGRRPASACLCGSGAPTPRTGRRFT